MGGEEWSKLGEAFNAGAPLADADPEQLKKFWRGWREIKAAMPRREGEGELGATSVDLIAAVGGIKETPSPAEFFALSMRANLLSGLFERGVLREFEEDGELSDSVFQVAATMAINIEDLGGVMLPLFLKKIAPKEAAEVKARWLAEGFDAEQPTIDKKFLEAVRKAQPST